MPLDLLTLHRFECACTHMQRKFLTVNACIINRLEHLFSEMKACCRGCYATLDFGVDRLIGGLVALLCLTIKIWRNRQFTHCVDHFCKGNTTRPLEIDAMGCAVNLSAGSTYYALCIMNYAFSRQRALFPLLQIAYQTIPCTMT